MKKKALACLLAAVMALSLAACGRCLLFKSFAAGAEGRGDAGGAGGRSTRHATD